MDIKKEQDVEKVQFSELIEKCKAYMASELSQEEFEAYCDKIYFRTYLPLEDKISILNNVLEEQFYDEDIDFMTYKLELCKFYIILLDGYTNIDVLEEERTLENYNICMMCIGDWLLKICEKDYKRIIEMLQNYINLHNISDIMLMVEKINNTSFDEYLKEQKKMFNWIKKNPDIFQKINDFTSFNDPKTKEILNNMKDSIKKNIKIE